MFVPSDEAKNKMLDEILLNEENYIVTAYASKEKIGIEFSLMIMLIVVFVLTYLDLVGPVTSGFIGGALYAFTFRSSYIGVTNQKLYIAYASYFNLKENTGNDIYDFSLMENIEVKNVGSEYIISFNYAGRYNGKKIKFRINKKVIFSKLSQQKENSEIISNIFKEKAN